MDIPKLIQDYGGLVGLMGTLFGIWHYYQRIKYEKKVKGIDAKRKSYETIIEILNPLDVLISDHLVSISPTKLIDKLDSMDSDVKVLEEIVEEQKQCMNKLEEVKNLIFRHYRKYKKIEVSHDKDEDVAYDLFSVNTNVEELRKKLKVESRSESFKELFNRLEEYIRLKRDIAERMAVLQKRHNENLITMEMDGNTLLECLNKMRSEINSKTSYKSVASEQIISLISELQNELVLKIDLLQQEKSNGREYHRILATIKNRIEDQIRSELKI